MSDTSDEELEVLKEINERQKREEDEKAARIASNRRAAKGCLIGFAAICALFAATCVAILGGDEPEYPPLAIDETAVLAEMQGAFESNITRVQVSGRPSNIRVDVYTDFYPDRDVAEVARGMALIAAQSSAVLEAYPSTSIDAYVWPRGEGFYMTRASASYTDGVLDGPIESYTNSDLR
jgi:hypothetical protein